jgi:hypothetical protein
MLPALGVGDLRIFDNEPRMQDLRLAEALGFARPRVIRELIGRYETRLMEMGGLPHYTANSGHLGGRPGTEFWLTRKQAIFICMKSDAPQAEPVQLEIIEVFDQWLDGKLAPRETAPASQILLDIQKTVERIDKRTSIIERTDGNVTYLKNRIDDIVPRREFPSWALDQYRLLVFSEFGRKCPCCARVVIVNEQAELLDNATIDHNFGRNKNKVGEGWPVCSGCNDRLNDPTHRQQRQHLFQTFHTRRKEKGYLDIGTKKSRPKNTGSKTWSSPGQKSWNF